MSIWPVPRGSIVNDAASVSLAVGTLNPLRWCLVECEWQFFAVTLSDEGALQEWRCLTCGLETAEVPEGGPRWKPAPKPSAALDGTRVANPGCLGEQLGLTRRDRRS